MSKIAIYILLLILLFGSVLHAQTTVTVTNKTDLNTQINNAVAGKTIILANTGVWTDVQLNFAKTGTAALPITIKAQTIGSVSFTGNSYIRMGGSFIVIDRIIFENASNISTSRPIIEFKNSSGTVCNDCKVTNIKIDTYNGTETQKTSTYKWILLEGKRNEISYCSFIGKYGVGSIINDNRNDNDPDYTKIHHNYFAGRTPIRVVNQDNDQDAIRIGNSSTSLSDSFTEVYDNYFYNFVGEIEIISNKSGNNKYYNNTFEDYSGALTLRHGNNCEVFNNFFLAKGHSFSGGVRVIGENHKIYNNYMEGTVAKYPDNSSTKGLAGINIHNGILNSDLDEYYQVKNATIVNNTFVNCDLGIRVGATFNSTQNQPPQNVVIANNIMYQNTERAIQVTTQLTGASSKYENNIKQNGTFDSFGSVTATGNINVTSGLLTSGTDFYRIASGSAAVDYGLGTYSFLTKDITGGSRPANFDAGAEELNSGGTFTPYKISDVGTIVGFGGSLTLSVSNENLKSESLKLYPNPVNGNYLNVSLKNKPLGHIKIINMLGKTVMESVIDNTSGKINVSSLSNGIYILKVQGVSKLFVK
ncbi:chondroitinase-B domain-containing protein [Mariniflexile sp.]|uniref:chondroitinase-B domain-containing protein n=1 Tax=Mariniflexile sp. TaxID=1979402 RepID=UPI004048790C